MIYSCFSGSLELSLLKFNVFLVCSFTKPLEVYYKKSSLRDPFSNKKKLIIFRKMKRLR